MIVFKKHSALFLSLTYFLVQGLDSLHFVFWEHEAQGDSGFVEVQSLMDQHPCDHKIFKVSGDYKPYWVAEAPFIVPTRDLQILFKQVPLSQRNKYNLAARAPPHAGSGVRGV